jgi:hypothetical protein
MVALFFFLHFSNIRLLNICLLINALQDAVILETFDTQKSNEIMKDIELFIKIRNKSNRKLARDVAEWVDVALSASHPKNEDTSDRRQLLAAGEDLEVDNDDI